MTQTDCASLSGRRSSYEDQERVHACSHQRHQPLFQPAEAGELFRPQSAWRQSGLRAAHHSRISKVSRSHALAELCWPRQAWAAAKTPDPRQAFFVRIRAKRGHQLAAVALARKLTVLCWNLLTEDADYCWTRPALIASKRRTIELKPSRECRSGRETNRTPCSEAALLSAADREAHSASKVLWVVT